MMTTESAVALTPETAFGPQNPFFAPSALPYQAPPFDSIRDSDYQPAIEAGIAQQLEEVQAIAANPAVPTFENTLVALEKTGQLLGRALAAFHNVAGANTNPTLQAIEEIVAPRLAALSDAIFLNEQLFARVAAVYDNRGSLRGEAHRLTEYYYERFVHGGAELSESDKAELRQLNEEGATLSNDFRNKVLAATREAAFSTTDASALDGLTDAQLASAALAAQSRGVAGWVVTLQNTTQQPILTQLSNRATRQTIFAHSLERTEQSDANDTRAIVSRLARLRARKARLLGYPSYAAWKLEDQMAKTPAEALKFLEALIPAATAKAAGEASDIQAVIDGGGERFNLEPWDWSYYAERVRKQKYDLDEAEIRPYFELNRVIADGVFHAATLLYGITFRQRRDLPVYHPDVQVFEVFEEDGRPLALLYCDNYKRDNKNGGAWMSSFVDQSRLIGTKPVITNVANFTKPADGEPALISFNDVTTLFHEFGHALHGLFADAEYPSLSGTAVARDFVEFPSQFNEHWATYPAVFENYAKHAKTGEPMPAELAAKIKKAATFNQGYSLTEVLAAARLDMEWHTLSADAPPQPSDAFERAALERSGLAIAAVPPRYRSSYFSHIWGGGYSAGYYAYLWAEMLDADGFQWFKDNGGLTRANGDRLRTMVLARGNSEDPAKMYREWLGRETRIEPMLEHRGLPPAVEVVNPS